MERKERLAEYINSKNYIPLKFEELAVVLDVPDEDKNELSRLLSELEREGRIICGKKGRYLPFNEKSQKYSGILKCNASGKFGFIVRDDGDDVYVRASDMGTALDGDRVIAKHTGLRNGKPEGSVIRVLERNTDEFTGVVITKHRRVLEVRADNKCFYPLISIRPDATNGAEVGQRVLIGGISVMPNRRVFGKIVRVLGDSDDISTYIESIIVENKIKTDFDEEIAEQLINIPDEINIPDDRADLRGMTVFTIDGELARDFDDAVSIEMTESGNFRLGVHIADVSEYVTPKSPLDKEAFERGTSVYLPDRVIPMLPEKLSNGICSLNPGVDRLTLSVFMEIDKNGGIVSHNILKSVICSKKRLTYTEVNNFFDGGEISDDVAESLETMRKLAEILRHKRLKRGAVDFDFPESEILTDKNGLPVEIRIAERGISNRMIEEFMLAANETVAEYAYWSELPFVYRVHEAPSPEKIQTFQEFLKPFGFSIKGKIDAENPVKPKTFEQLIEKTRGTPCERIIAKTMLRSMMKAEYRPENLGHFGLAAKYYCHFTSPIRRYPDLVVHRSIKQFLDGNVAVDEKFTAAAAANSSEREISAEYCERDCDELLKAAFMQGFIGCEFEGIVSGVTSFGMFVELETGIEGMVRLENMTDDYFNLDTPTQSLCGERTGKRYTVGDCVSVMVVGCSLLSRNIDFILSENVSKRLLKEFFGKRREK